MDQKIYRGVFDMRQNFHSDLPADLMPEELELFDVVLLKLAREVPALP